MTDVHPLRRWRKEHGLTAADLASRVGVVASQITQIETGKREPSVESASRLVKETGLDLAEIKPTLADLIRGDAA